MAATLVVSIPIDGLKHFKSEIDAQLNGGTGPIQNALTQWAMRTRGFLQQRFDKYSKGGGDWAPLAESTIQKKTRGKGGAVSILRDYGLLFAVLNPVFLGTPGAIQENIPFGIRIGYGGGSGHTGGEGSSVSIADIASFHQVGNSILPIREIIVIPPQEVQDLMAEDMDRAIKKQWDGMNAD